MIITVFRLAIVIIAVAFSNYCTLPDDGRIQNLEQSKEFASNHAITFSRLRIIFLSFFFFFLGLDHTLGKHIFVCAQSKELL